MAEYQRALAEADAIVGDLPADWQARDESPEAERGLAIAQATAGQTQPKASFKKRVFTCRAASRHS